MAKRALCVGINSYDLQDQNLTGCTNDANAWLKLLVEHYDFPRSDVRLMVDSEATRAGILGGLKDLFEGARPGDVLVFANSSHGSYVVDRGVTRRSTRYCALTTPPQTTSVMTSCAA